jgi:hypothetical protein
MKTDEQKVAEALVNLTESHWFNAAIFGRYLATQPLYTVDRVIEMVAYIVSEQSKIHHRAVVENGTSSEGLILANELHECIKASKEIYEYENLRLPK